MKFRYNAFATIMILALTGVFSNAILAAPPANDFWESAETISGSSGTKIGLNFEATTQGCELDHIFDESHPTTAKRTVWYKWIAPAGGSYTFRINSAGFDTTLSAYRFIPGICNGSLTNLPNRITENDQFNTRFGNGDLSQITFRVIANEPIYISVDSRIGIEGTFVLAWEKNRFKYAAQLDSHDGGTDLLIGRQNAANIEWWQAFWRNFYPFDYDRAVSFGLNSDKSLAGDFDGDRLTDLAAIRSFGGQLTWWISSRKGNIIKVQPFGLSTDHPIVGDYDGDGIADIAVTRPEANGTKTWHILRSSDGQYQSFQFGLAGDRQTAGDYDGDGKTDVVVIRIDSQTNQFTWYILRSSDGAYMIRQFGQFGDFPQIADFDNDGKTDITVFRYENFGADESQNGNWYSLDSSSPLPLAQVPTRVQKFGKKYDWAQPGDYDADGKTDLAVYRSGIWWVKQSSNGEIFTYNFGIYGDRLVTDLGMNRYFY